jgi:hypothetical protein
LIVSLFLPDAWILGDVSDSYDDVLNSILVVVLVFFTLEICVLSIVDPAYPWSFFFFMDVIGTASVFLDIGGIVPQGSQELSNTNLFRATRTAKIGARYGRLFRLMKLMKLMTMLPCLSEKPDEDKKDYSAMSAVRRVSAELSSALSRRVAALVFVLVVVLPFLVYVDTDYSLGAFLDGLQVIVDQGQVDKPKPFLLLFFSDN